MAFDFGQFGQTDAADPTSDFLQRERQAAGSLLGNDTALFGGSGAQENQEHDFERRAQDFPALDDENDFEDALSGAPEQPVVPATGVPTGSTLMRADSLAEFGEPEPHAGVTRTDSLAEFSEPEAPRVPEENKEANLEEQFEAHYPEAAELDSGAVPAPVDQERRAVDEPEVMQPSDKKTPFTYEGIDEESDALRSWRAKQEEDIARRDAQAERMRAEAASKAEQEIDQFYADYNAEKEKNIRKNKCVPSVLTTGRPKRASASKSSTSWPRARPGRALPSSSICRTASRRRSPRSARGRATWVV